MAVPYHRDNCKTTMYSTNCPDCQSKVWYFGCSCGSKVFFQSPGPPWPKHLDYCPNYAVLEMLDEGKTPRQIRNLIETKAKSFRNELPIDILEYLNVLGAPGKTVKRIIVPTISTLEFQGFLKEIRPINFYNRLGINKNQFYDAILGRFSENDYVEMIVEEYQDAGQLLVDRCEFVIPKSEVDDSPPKINMRIVVKLKGEKLINDQLIWVVDEIDWFDR